MAKATRQLHISEDVFSGYNHTVRKSVVCFYRYVVLKEGLMELIMAVSC